MLPLFSLGPWLDSTLMSSFEDFKWKKVEETKGHKAELKKLTKPKHAMFEESFRVFSSGPFPVPSHHFKYSIHSWKFFSHLRHTVITVSGAYEHTNALMLIPIKLEPTFDCFNLSHHDILRTYRYIVNMRHQQVSYPILHRSLKQVMYMYSKYLQVLQVLAPSSSWKIMFWKQSLAFKVPL